MVGGALLALGLLTAPAAALIMAVMTAAALTAHRGKGLWVTSGGFELPLVFGLVAFALAAIGVGEVSLDAVLGLGAAGAQAQGA